MSACAMSRRTPRRPGRWQQGLSLVELMLGMVLGLFLIGGVVSVFVANQQTSTVKQALDRAQENFRFGALTLTRVVRQGTAIDPDSSASELVVAIAGGAGAHDCVGQPLGGTNTFRVNAASALVCIDANNVEHVLMGDVAALNVSFGVDGDGDAIVANDEYVTDTAVADWGAVRSVQASLVLTNGQVLPFVAAMRPAIIAAYSAAVADADDGDGEAADEGAGSGETGSEGDGDAGGGDDGSDGSDSGDGGGDGGGDTVVACFTTVSGSRKPGVVVTVTQPAGQPACSLTGSGGSSAYSCVVTTPTGTAISVHHAGSGANDQTESTTANCGGRTINF